MIFLRTSMRWGYGPVTQDALDRALTGDEHAFRELTDPYRRELLVHCYRMLGSLTDAEDTLQETLIAAWRGLSGFAGRASLRAWLYRIATNRCLNALRDAGRRRPAEPTPPFDPPEPTRRSAVTWLQPYPDTLLEQVADRMPGPEARYQSKEAVELAFIAGVQHLPPRQAAALVLRDVLGYSTAEVADMLGTTTTAVKGAVQRARAQLRNHTIDPERTAPPDSPHERDLAARFAEAFTTGDTDGVITLLTDDAWLAMPPAPHEYHGPAAIAAFLTTFTTWRGPRRFRLVPTRANTQPAFGCYLTGPDESTAHPAGILVLTLRTDRIRSITWFLGDLTHPFGLPETIG
ncbi:RNA polymerase sigma-70 factor (ECF subfamily) [Murinocardiopsis flavida]|uniref:RNA polymerase sigma-70 factor (ECF subfamily) n=1 Tax=Murinocardiopsis flavida TaxID=645275 RepID=A0A2P8D194_9ACTN|nr:RNA polymerase subunit sigma-70 [Murinocardiopsis flavida]PSK90979.1 RNA polymerase sigma-70 factor (ECF subfamily) [Murinocardiopsis flavida]